MKTAEIFGKRLRQARLERGLSQAELARRGYCVSALIWHYEHGSYKNVPLNRVWEFARILNVEPAWLAGFTE